MEDRGKHGLRRALLAFAALGGLAGLRLLTMAPASAASATKQHDTPEQRLTHDDRPTMRGLHWRWPDAEEP